MIGFEALGAVGLWVVSDHIVVNSFGSSVWLCWLEVSCSNFALPKAPVFDLGHFMKRRFKWFFEAVSFNEM